MAATSAQALHGMEGSKANTAAGDSLGSDPESPAETEAARLSELSSTALAWKDKARKYDFDDDLDIVDPECHSRLLEILQARLLRDSEFAKSRGQYSATSEWNPASVEIGKLEDTPTAILQASTRILRGIIIHFWELRKHGYATDYFSILVKRQPTVAELVPIYYPDLIQLQTMLQIRLAEVDQPFDEVYRPVDQLLTQTIKSITRVMGESLYGKFICEGGSAINRCYGCLWLIRVLEVGLISYAGSHMTRLKTYPGLSTDRVTISHPAARPRCSVQFYLCSLACLSMLVNGAQVWVLEEASPTEHSFGIDLRTIPLLLLTSMPRLADVWGPVYAVPDPATGKILQYNTTRGVIRKTRAQGPPVRSLVDEKRATYCHWEPAERHFLRRCSGGIKKLFGPPPAVLEPDDMLLIGQDLETNDSCPYTLDALQQDLGPELGMPGTRPESWEVDGMSASISFPRYFNFSIAGTRKKIPATTLKQLIRDRWTSNPARANPIILQKSLGVEVSHCTGNARRVPLKDLLMHDLVRALLELQMPGWATSDWGVALQKALAHENPEEILVFWKSHMDARSRVGELVASLLELLDDTGSDNKDFRAVLLNNNVEYLIKMPLRLNSWANILRDTDRTATYALVTNRCLQYESRHLQAEWRAGCSQSKPSEQNTRLHTKLWPDQYTCLHTKLSSGKPNASLVLRGDLEKLKYRQILDSLVPAPTAFAGVKRVFWSGSASPFVAPSCGDRSEIVDDIQGLVPAVKIRALRPSFGGQPNARQRITRGQTALTPHRSGSGGTGEPTLGARMQISSNPGGTNSPGATMIPASVTVNEAQRPDSTQGNVIGWLQGWTLPTDSEQQHSRQAASGSEAGQQGAPCQKKSVALASGMLTTSEPREGQASAGRV